MEKIENKFLSIFQNPLLPNLLDLSDGILYTEDGCHFPIHRYDIARNSKYFQALFVGVDNDRKEYIIPNISGSCLCDILYYLYTGDIVVTDANITDLFTGANYLLLTDMYQKIKQNVKTCMTEDNCLKIVHTASLFDDQDLINESIRFIEVKFKKIIGDHRTELENLSASILYKILSCHSLYVFNENTVWEIIVQWTEKDAHCRQSHVPQLLASLAIEEVDEKLATEILHHKIVSTNPYMEVLNIINSSNNFSNNRDMLLGFIQNYSNHFINPCYFRIPKKLCAIILFAGGYHAWKNIPNEHGKSDLYITYDENVDLWCKIAEVDFRVAFMTVIEHNIFIFGDVEQIWVKFNLISMEWTPMENFRFHTPDPNSDFFIVAVEMRIYVFFVYVDARDEYGYDFKIYDTQANVWLNGVRLPNIHNIACVVGIDKGIFVIGIVNFAENEWIMKKFDVLTHQWTLFPLPIHIYNNIIINTVAYHNKIYTINNKKILNVFDPEIAIWKELPGVPFIRNRFRFVVFDDQLFIFGRFYENKVNARWNEANQCWEQVENLDFLRNINVSENHFFEIEDVNLIRTIMKRNRRNETLPDVYEVKPNAEFDELERRNKAGFSFNKI